MTEDEARKRQQAMIAKRRERAALNQRIRSVVHRGEWDELDRITEQLVRELEDEISQDAGETEISPENPDDASD